ncbi:uncharacterized protein LOC125545049 [Triticum urartu]|uniref:Uncharacterized protein n=1 Tax=Triticum urartu TaxID=4572 RepID=A0A8R7TYM2_TRIUA|nr:uncharacterized protein LOC125545049 [Triticum urartu]
MQQPHRRSPLTATTPTHAAATVAPRASPGRALPQPHVSFSDTHRPRSTCEPHTHRREVLIDPLHGLVLAVTARRPGTERGKIRGAAHGVSISSSCSSILVGYRLVRAAEMVNSSLGAPGWCGLIFQEIKSYGYMLSVKVNP